MSLSKLKDQLKYKTFHQNKRNYTDIDFYKNIQNQLNNATEELKKENKQTNINMPFLFCLGSYINQLIKSPQTCKVMIYWNNNVQMTKVITPSEKKYNCFY